MNDCIVGQVFLGNFDPYNSIQTFNGATNYLVIGKISHHNRIELVILKGSYYNSEKLNLTVVKERKK